MAKRKLLPLPDVKANDPRPNTRRMAVKDDKPPAKDSTQWFRATSTADDAECLTDGVLLSTPSSNDTVILPWMGFGTYKLGKDVAYQAVLDALSCGYRCIDTAFIYGGETTERLVGNALQTALKSGLLENRKQAFVVTKHWRKYHGYDATLQCLNLSLKRLQVDYIDCYLMHWPGPAWKTMNRRKDILEAEGPWYYAADNQHADQITQLRSETWRAMEDLYKEGKIRSIGVSNFSVEHLEALKKTATIWPPAVNQVEFHPLYVQANLLKYCRQEGIVLQAYASLGGQDTGKKQWKRLSLEASERITRTEESKHNDQKPVLSKPGGKKKPQIKKLRDTVVSLLSCRPVVEVAQNKQATPAQVLLRWALSQNCAVIPKSSSKDRMIENAGALKFSLSQDEIDGITNKVHSSVTKAMAEEGNTDQEAAIQAGRLCWRNDPLRHLNFE